MHLEETIKQRLAEMGGRIRVKSALNPVLWLCGIVTVPSILLMVHERVFPVWLIVLAMIPVGCAAIGFLFLLIFDRDKLQSEDYQLRKQTLELIQEKGDKFPIIATSIQAIANPNAPQVPVEPKEAKK